MTTKDYIRHWASHLLRRRYRGPLILLFLLLLAGAFAGLWIRESQLQRSLEKQEQELDQARGQMRNRAARIRLDSMLLHGGPEQVRSFLDQKQASLNSQDRNHARQVLERRKEKQRKDSLRKARRLSSRQEKVQFWRDSLSHLHQRLRQRKDSARRAIQAQNQKIRQLEDSLREEPDRQFVQFYNQKGNRVYYLGEVRRGKAQGQGVGIWRTGSLYRGEWKNNRRHGKGSFEWKDGERYEGEYRQGMRHGKGTYYWTNGEKFVGQWRNDQRNGEGVFYDRNGEVLARGIWENDELVERQ